LGTSQLRARVLGTKRSRPVRLHQRRGHIPESATVSAELATAADRTPTIMAAGTAAHPDPLGRATLRTFVSVLGAQAGNFVLPVLATGGLYIGGGLPPRMLRDSTGREERFLFSRSRRRGAFPLSWSACPSMSSPSQLPFLASLCTASARERSLLRVVRVRVDVNHETVELVELVICPGNTSVVRWPAGGPNHGPVRGAAATANLSVGCEWPIRHTERVSVRVPRARRWGEPLRTRRT
jgi:hypothetical protein